MHQMFQCMDSCYVWGCALNVPVFMLECMYVCLDACMYVWMHVCMFGCMYVSMRLAGDTMFSIVDE
jgi:hypothetical protein